MKRIFASLFVSLLSFPIAGFACGGGDCSMDLPPPEVPVPGPVENLISSFSEHNGLFAGMALAAVVAVAPARQRQLLETKSAAPLIRPSA
ncbi:hypothetical protein BH18VER1_BH18VER1_13890 [soil metagenome]